MNELVSIIIPALNEEQALPRLIKGLQDRSGCEVILVDGGSTDRTLLLAKQAGWTILSSPPGRGRQMNMGAEMASGEILLFLHADTQLPINFLHLIQKTLNKHGVAAGAFSLKIAGNKKGLAIIAWCTNLRSRYLHLPYGDQAIFTRRTTFLTTGGFPAIDIMEDFIFIRSIQKLGTISILTESITTSARRWQNLGILRTTIINQIIICSYFLGVKPAKLALFYKRMRGVKQFDKMPPHPP